MIYNLGENNSLFNQFISEIRDREIQADSLRFRKNLERVGELFAYEISKTLNYKETEVETPLGTAVVPKITDQVLLGTIMRAGLPLQNGILNYYDRAECAFISAYRKYHNDGTFDIKFEYISSPATEGKVLILSDTMLATGASMVLAYKAFVNKGKPSHTHIVCVIASKEGVAYLSRHLDMSNITLWVGAIDDELTVKSYIVPGLGDAGDLAFGGKE